jgi:hypothetical protein
MANLLGSPLEIGLKLLPDKWTDAVNETSRKALLVALKTALLTMDKKPSTASLDIWHKIAVAATGAGGGAFGLAALTLELPISTTIMLRSIADIARSKGEDLSLTEPRLACLEVLAFGGPTKKDDAAGSGYFTVRASLATAVTEATQFIAEKGLAREGAPAIVRLISQVSKRFGLSVTEKAAAQSLPAVGAIGGGLINLMFIDHFQAMARGHFTVRSLERIYGKEKVEKTYLQLAAGQ